MADSIAAAVEYNRNIPNSWLSIREVCDKMLEKEDKTDVVERYANTVHMMLAKFGQNCVPTKYSEHIKNLQKEDWAATSNSYRIWMYQSCTEYGYFATSSRTTDTFSPRFPVEFFIQMCRDIFSSKFDKKFLNEAADRTNTDFGARDINVNRILYVHGSIDPWYALGLIRQDKKKLHKVIFIKGGSHCEDMRTESYFDSKQLKKAREDIEKTLDSWLEEY